MKTSANKDGLRKGGELDRMENGMEILVDRLSSVQGDRSTSTVVR